MTLAWALVITGTFAKVGTVCTASVNDVKTVGKCTYSTECKGESSVPLSWFCSGAYLDCCVTVSPKAKATYEENKKYLGTPCKAPFNGKTFNGSCRYTSVCASGKLTSVPGDSCPGADNIQCCIKPHVESEKDITARVNALPKTKGTAYISGNPKTITLVTIQDRDMEITTAIAFEKMYEAAYREGKDVRILSAFRTMDEQEYHFKQFSEKKGPFARKPGYSSLQSGIGLNLDVKNADVRAWLESNSERFGFCRTSKTFTWHYQYRPTDKSGCLKLTPTKPQPKKIAPSPTPKAPAPSPTPQPQRRAYSDVPSK